MIDFQKEHLRTLSEAARLLPGRPHVSTLHRWARPRVLVGDDTLPGPARDGQIGKFLFLS